MKQKPTKGKYRSVPEHNIAKELEELKVPFTYERKVLGYTSPPKPHKYTPDFKIGNIYVEVKGFFKREDRVKMLLVTQQHPDKDIRMLLLANNKLYKGSPTRYSDWCEKNNIKYAIGKSIPKEWIEESNHNI